MSPLPDLSESLAWLDFCLGETEAAMAAVKAAAAPAFPGTGMQYHGLCEMAAQIITFRRRCAGLARWMVADG